MHRLIISLEMAAVTEEAPTDTYLLLDRSYFFLSSVLLRCKPFAAAWVQIQQNPLVGKNKGHTLSPWHDLEGCVSPNSELFYEH